MARSPCADDGDIARLDQSAGAAVDRGDFNRPFDHLDRGAGRINRDAEGRALHHGGQIGRANDEVGRCALSDTEDGIAEMFDDLSQAVSRIRIGDLQSGIGGDDGVLLPVDQHGASI